jgi:Lar family restriction alleviation protein
MDELKSCPFCGEKNEIYVCKMNHLNTFMVQCQNCGSMGPKIPTDAFGLALPEDGESESIRRWNNRS